MVVVVKVAFHSLFKICPYPQTKKIISQRRWPLWLWLVDLKITLETATHAFLPKRQTPGNAAILNLCQALGVGECCWVTSFCLTSASLQKSTGLSVNAVKPRAKFFPIFWDMSEKAWYVTYFPITIMSMVASAVSALTIWPVVGNC